VAPGFAAPPVLHAHVSDDVTLIVTDGALVVAGPGGDVEVRAGSTMVIPHGAPFAWRNASADEPAVYLGVYAPGGFEQYFIAVADAVAEHGGLPQEIVAPLWKQYGIALA
jgi:mannose-6-phosphate isomerase-like protein (cupin superfamily)